MLRGAPPTIGGIPSLQICHKFKMFQKISFKKPFKPFSQVVTGSINIILSVEMEKSEIFRKCDILNVSQSIKSI